MAHGCSSRIASRGAARVISQGRKPLVPAPRASSPGGATPLDRKPQASSLKPLRAFTLIEILVVITIIALLMGLLIPAITHFKKVQRKAAVTTVMGGIQVALSAYGADHRSELPPSQSDQRDFGLVNAALLPAATMNNWQGAERLAQALVGPLPALVNTTPTPNIPGDGKDGYGFKATGGKVSGAYFEIKNESGLRARGDKNSNSVLDRDEFWIDENVAVAYAGKHVLSMPYSRTGMPFLYYRAESMTMTAGQTGDDFKVAATAIFGPDGRFDTHHNDQLCVTPKDPVAKWKRPDFYTAGARQSERENFAIELRRADYLLVSPGPDDLWGKAGDKDNEEDDDIFFTGSRNP